MGSDHSDFHKVNGTLIPADPTHRRSDRPLKLIACIGTLLFVLLILTGFIIMITVLVSMHPHKPSYSLEDLQITQLLITQAPPRGLTAATLDPVDSRLNLDVIVTIAANNTNKHLKIYKSRLVVILYYNRNEIGRTNFINLYQESQNAIMIQRVISIRDHPLRHSDAASLNAASANSAVVEFQSKIAALVQYKYGIWTSRWHKWFRVYCELVVSSLKAPTGSHLLLKRC